ncbi:glutamate--tRNA ligase [Pectinatus haikarae]|uniref:Glutamate--tRNA ligase n=1 Tax=Pectinatus haikarae TaxID=349096 RepID=A0ABT9Y4M3_9FIRM|nr:glutamate--tRNA ligase [Pectinatus haikarae]MDQ0202773.1 nondiscriminating glutamyl-tRNA synthetase [Pectinatus haikarae]
MSEQIRVRFAPSPTGPFHIGGARSALFNWLLARKYSNGKFVLRVEDTDRVRSSKESEENIKASLKWLGLDWDEGVDVGGEYGPYHQMERLELYKKYAQQLVDEGKAYYCYCTEEEIAAEREALMKENKMPIYQGHCRHLTADQIEKYKSEGRKPTIRFRTPENETVEFDDMVRGHMQFDSNGVGDFVIVKADGIPVYNFAVVIDDALMNITHVIRAEEHLSNTPRQVVLYDALGFTVPVFAHISLILGKDHSKMSKRHGATSVEQYKNLGYLPEALVNFLALLGWAPQDEKEIFSIDELIKAFSMDHVAKNPAVFDIDKLNWLNAQYMKKLSTKKITMMAVPHLLEKGYLNEPIAADEMAKLVRFTEIIRDHLSYGAQFLDFADLYFNDDIVVEDAESKQILTDETVPSVIGLFKEKLNGIADFDAEHIQPIFKQITKELKVGGKKVYMPVRISVTGQMHGPDLAGIIEVLGRERVFDRIEKVLPAL